MDNLVTIAFFAVFAVVLGRILVNIFKHGGLKGALFGAPIARTVGEVSAAGRGPVRATLKVHVLGGPGASSIGLEFAAKSFASYQMMPATLSADDARKLASLLEAAASSLVPK
jgi:hypothetical protein